MLDPSIFTHPLFLLAVLVEFLFKGISLWRAGRNNQGGWFVALFIINSAGLLPIIYLLAFQKNKNRKMY